MKNKLAFVVLILFFAYLLVGFASMRPFGNPEYEDMDQYIINNAQTEAGANNVVTSVVLDFRSLDTLGEASVLFTAVTSSLVVIRRLHS